MYRSIEQAPYRPDIHPREVVLAREQLAGCVWLNAADTADVKQDMAHVQLALTQQGHTITELKQDIADVQQEVTQQNHSGLKSNIWALQQAVTQQWPGADEADCPARTRVGDGLCNVGCAGGTAQSALRTAQSVARRHFEHARLRASSNHRSGMHVLFNCGFTVWT